VAGDGDEQCAGRALVPLHDGATLLSRRAGDGADRPAVRQEAAMDLGLEGKVAVVTGAGAGIGLAVCRALAAEGMRVVGASRRDPEDVVDGVEHHRLDLTAPGTVESLVDRAVDRHGSLALLVNNAGSGTIRDGFLSATDDDWVGLFALNLMVAVRATRAALPHLCVDGGAIVNISSINGVAPDTKIPDYSATKAALNSFGKSIATEYGDRGVRVVSVSPGPTRTAMWLGPAGVAQVVAAQLGVTPEEVVAGAEREIPLGRLAEPAEIAAVVAFLGSPRASYVSGVDLLVDGGLIPTL
jgi:NAD(P)-dependent dehydrogenase (short-subunit alcohol dehydrogenase family)